MSTQEKPTVNCNLPHLLSCCTPFCSYIFITICNCKYVTNCYYCNCCCFCL